MAGEPIKPKSANEVSSAPTAEQRRAIEVEAERQRELAKLDAERTRRDRALTQSFSSEAEIDVARAVVQQPAVGVALVLLGNVLVLMRRPPRRRPVPA